jgi:hypothetical protein
LLAFCRVLLGAGEVSRPAQLLICDDFLSVEPVGGIFPRYHLHYYHLVCRFITNTESFNLMSHPGTLAMRSRKGQRSV